MTDSIHQSVSSFTCFHVCISRLVFYKTLSIRIRTLFSAFFQKVCCYQMGVLGSRFRPDGRFNDGESPRPLRDAHGLSVFT